VGNGELKTAVVDAGPLIHLAEIGCFRLLRAFGTLWVPHAVWLETAEHNRLSQNDLSGEPNILQYSSPQFKVAHFCPEREKFTCQIVLRADLRPAPQRLCER